MMIGSMDRKIVIERSTTGARDAAGSPTITWATLYRIWAKVVPMSGTESLRLERQVATQISRFFIRYVADLKVTDRILYEGKYWDIINWRELGRRESIEITAELVE
jgi:SPP1 family predicted phage head-tail adaptor